MRMLLRVVPVLVCLLFAGAGIVGCKQSSKESSGDSKSGGDSKKEDGKKAEGDGDKGSKVEVPDEGGNGEPTPVDADPDMERGAYLAAIMGCPICHTPLTPKGPDKDKLWAGGLEVTEVFGRWRSTNITPDKETGIGDWTDEQIIAAIREGVRPDGSRLYPVMPYPFYRSLSDDDAQVLVKFLRGLKPIQHKVERVTDLKLPKPELPKPDGKPPGDSPEEIGRYYADIMHCALCHTPPGKSGEPDMKKLFAGGFPMEVPEMGEGILYSANLTPDKKTGIGDWTDEQIIDAIRKMKKKDGGVIRGPMMLYQGGWIKLTDDHAKAIVAYLRSLPAIENKIPESTFKPRGHP